MTELKKGLGELGLVVVHEQADVVQLDLVPHVHGLAARVELFFEPVHAFAHTQVVKLDALALRALLRVPVGRLEAVLGARRFGAKEAVVAVEAVHHGLGDAIGLGCVEALGKHGVRDGERSGLQA